MSQDHTLGSPSPSPPHGTHEKPIGSRFRELARPLGPPVVPDLPHSFVGWEGSPTKTDYRKKGTLVLTALLEDLVHVLSVGMWVKTNGTILG